MDITIVNDPRCPGGTVLAWDTVWNAEEGRGDWAVADAGDKNNAGGLRAKAAIATSVINLLFTDAACPSDHPLFHLCEGDPRGYWGDGITLGADDATGSLLWVLERGLATDEMARWGKQFAEDGLKPLLTQGVCARIDVACAVLPGLNGVSLEVKLYGRDGSTVYQSQYDVAWRQISR